MKMLFSLSAFASVVLAVVAADESGFNPIFNGKDLTGWDGNPKLWSVEEACITGRTGTNADNKLTHNTFLVWTNGLVDSFELRLSYKIVGGNSGIQYRSKVVEKGKFGPIVAGYQADFEAGSTYSGILYEERGRQILAQRGQKTTINPDPANPKKHKVEVTGSVGESKEIQSKILKEDWNEYVVIAKGNHLQHFINGMQTIDVTDEHEAGAAKSGVLALQIHVGGPMTVQFKNIRIKKLGGGSAAAGGLQKFAGKWVPVEVTINGQPVEKDKLDSVLLTIEGNRYKSVIGDKTDEGMLTIDDSKSPAAMDVLRKKSDGEEVTVPAIFEFKGDALKICYAVGTQARPTEFKSEADSGTLLVTYKRE